MLAAVKAVVDSAVQVPMNCHLVFTLTEEVGSGARAVIGSDVSEVIGVDIGPVATGQGAQQLASNRPSGLLFKTGFGRGLHPLPNRYGRNPGLQAGVFNLRSALKGGVSTGVR